MKRDWPRVTGLIRFEFQADHAMTRIGHGCEVRHTHPYIADFGWTHEIGPYHGYTHELMKQQRHFAEVVARVSGQYLNDVLPMQPSAEVLALWLLAQTEPAYCDHVIVQTYDNYTARADRSEHNHKWTEFLAGRGPDPYSNAVYTLK